MMQVFFLEVECIQVAVGVDANILRAVLVQVVHQGAALVEATMHQHLREVDQSGPMWVQ